MAEEPMLEAKGIVKVLGEGAAQVQALKGINLDLMPGGSPADGALGQRQDHSCRSRLHPVAELRHAHIARHTAPGCPLSSLPTCAANVGFVFQSYNLVPTLTATENISSRSICAAPPSQAPALAAKALAGGPVASGQRDRASSAAARSSAPRLPARSQPRLP
jgi:putative ABC transport system ATP-binding protein